MADEHMDRILERVNPGKRDFLKKVVVGTAFAAPLVASFSLDGLSLYEAHAQGASNVTVEESE
jgi:hypothetical protein